MQDRQPSRRAEATAEPGRTLSFGAFQFDSEGPLLSKNGSAVPLAPRPLAVLECLLERPGKVVSKQHLMDAVWDGTSVTEDSLVQAINRLRHALGDDPDSPTYIQTLHRRGYRLIAPVSVVGDGAAAEILDRTPEAVARLLDLVSRWRWPLLWAASLVVVAVGTVVMTTGGDEGALPLELATLEVAFPFPDDHPLEFGESFALSPDGQSVVYPSTDRALYVWGFDEREAERIPDSERGRNPFFSPDGLSIGFRRGGEIVIAPRGGGEPRIVCRCGHGRGATWGTDEAGNGMIIFSQRPTLTPGLEIEEPGGLFRIPATGGSPVRLTTPEESEGEHNHIFPQILPGGQAVLFTVWTRGRIGVLDLRTRDDAVLIDEATHPRYVPSGHLVFTRGGELFAVAFDPDRLKITSKPVPVLDGLVAFQPVMGYFDVSASGSLAYVKGPIPTSRSNYRSSLFDRQGHEEPFPIPVDWKDLTNTLEAPRAFQYPPALSPDGLRIAVARGGTSNSDLWVTEPGREEPIRLTFGPDIETVNAAPVWGPRGEKIIFARGKWQEPESLDLYSVAANGTAPPEPLLVIERGQSPESVSPDGRLLIYSELHPQTGWDIWALPLDGEGEPFVLVDSPGYDRVASLSPDGRWLLYQSDESGQRQVYVQPFPGPGRPIPMTRREDRAGFPAWSRDGQEIFYRISGDPASMWAVPAPQPGSVDSARPTDLEFDRGEPQKLFELKAAGVPAGVPGYQVTSEGKFLFMTFDSEDRPATELTVVANWFLELERLVPSGR